MKTIAQIQSELCQSGIGKLTSPPSLLQVIGQLYDGVQLNPPPVETFRIELEDGSGDILLEDGSGYIIQE